MDKASAEKILGLDKPYTKIHVTKARNKLAKKYHPDVAKDKTEQEDTTEKMQEINAAHQCLIELFSSSEIETINPETGDTDTSENDNPSSDSSEENRECAIIYSKACYLLFNAKDIYDIERAAEYFSRIKSYRDSSECFVICLLLIQKHYEQFEEKHEYQTEKEKYKEEERKRRKQEAYKKAQREKEKKEQEERDRKRKAEQERRELSVEYNKRIKSIKDGILNNKRFDWEMTLICALIIAGIVSLILEIAGVNVYSAINNFFGNSPTFDWKGDYLEADSYSSAIDNLYYCFILVFIVLLCPPVCLLLKRVVAYFRKEKNGYILDPCFFTAFTRAILLAVLCPAICFIILDANEALSYLELFLRDNIFIYLGDQGFAFELFAFVRYIFVFAAHILIFISCGIIYKKCKDNHTGEHSSKFWRHVSRSCLCENLLCFAVAMGITFLCLIPAFL